MSQDVRQFRAQEQVEPLAGRCVRVRERERVRVREHVRVRVRVRVRVCVVLNQ